MKYQNKAVIGLGFGDEGKGLVTNYLCLQNPNALVVRYSGGQQAGHTVVKNEVRHIFSNFGSGSLNGNSTYWSNHCTVDPIGINNELQVLGSKECRPILYIDPKCPITTPYDKLFNQFVSKVHGTVGVGVGATWQREEDFYSLLAEDLYYPSIVEMKLKLIKRYYQLDDIDLSYFMESIEVIKNYAHITISSCPISQLIYEGSQGLLLDPKIGFFPHVTRSRTGTANIDPDDFPHLYAVTRAYQTRHGIGPMTNEEIPHTISKNPLETNVYNEYQGELRISLLDLDLLEYGIEKDLMLRMHRNTLVITCLDHINSDLRLTYRSKIHKFKTQRDFVLMVNDILMFDQVLISRSDKSEQISEFK